MIRTNDFIAQWRDVRDAAHDAFERVGARGWYILGTEVEHFEKRLAEMCGVGEVVGVGSGLDALEIALRVLGLRAGDRVVTTPLSAFASTLAIVRAGGTPVFVDVDERGLLDLDRVEHAVRRDPALRWLLPVHLYGHALDLDRLEVLRDDFGLRIVEDCAQAVGARWRGRPVGTVGQVAAASFYPTKNLGAMGDSGALLTSDKELAARARRLRHYGQSATYVHEEFGLNSRLDELQAALLGRVMLPRLSGWTERRRTLARRYGESIRSTAVEVPQAEAASESVWHLYPVVLRAGERTEFREQLLRAGIETGVHYPTLIPEQRAFEKQGSCQVLDGLQRARRFAEREVSLPIHPYLTDEDAWRVGDVVSAWRSAS